jgi:hypothetical protein
MGVLYAVAMRVAAQRIALALLVLGAGAWGCGARPGEGGRGGVGTVGGGGGTEIFDGGQTRTDGSSGGSGASSGGATSGSGASTGGTASTGANSGSTGASGASGSSSSSGAGGEAIDAGDSGTGGIVLTIPPGPVHLVSLNWTISGPNTYKGSVEFGDAQSVEWVVGGILAARGYTLSVVGTDAAGDPCRGMSPPFNVVPGISTYTTITITCDTGGPDPADVTTGSVAIEAGIVAASD